MTPAFDALQRELKQLPGIGYRSAERIAIHLLLEQPERCDAFIDALQMAREKVESCPVCGNLSEGGECEICLDDRRGESGQVCVVERVSDIVSMEKSGAYRGSYHALHGKLSPINGIGPEALNIEALVDRVRSGTVSELILALPNDIEGEATCYYLTDLLKPFNLAVSRIGFGLPSGGSVLYADAVTLKSALEGRQEF